MISFIWSSKISASTTFSNNREKNVFIGLTNSHQRRLVYVMTTHLRQHGLMSFISLNIPEREINLHFVNSAGLQKNAPFCILLKKNPFFHGFIILYLKFWLHRFYIQNAAVCTILRLFFWRFGHIHSDIDLLMLRNHKFKM
jgi:hypothetical protein